MKIYSLKSQIRHKEVTDCLFDYLDYYPCSEGPFTCGISDQSTVMNCIKLV